MVDHDSIARRLGWIDAQVQQWHSALRTTSDQQLNDTQRWSKLWSAWLRSVNLYDKISELSFIIQSQIREREAETSRAKRVRGQVGDSSQVVSPRWTGSYSWSSLEESLEESELDETLSSLTPVELLSSLNKTLQSLMFGAQTLRESLVALPADALDSDDIMRRLDYIGESLARNNRDTQLSDVEETRRALLLVHESRLLKRLIARIEDRPGTFQADLISEIFSLGEVEWYLESFKVAQVEDQFHTIYFDGLEREVYSFEMRVNDYEEGVRQLGEEDASHRLELVKSCWRCLLRGGELQVSVHVAPIDQSAELIERCHVARATLRSLISELCAPLEDEPFIELFNELNWEMLYYASDLMSDIDHTSIHCSIFRLESVERDLKWYLAWERLAKINAEEHPHFAASLKRLNKQSHQVRVELQEKCLQSRLEGIFGERLVKRFEQLVFALIFVVLGLLCYELVAVDESDHDTRRMLALIDTGICGVFLLEFFVKIGLARERLFYLRRRWFIDLLPSIPFMYFTDYLFLDHIVAARSAKLAHISRVARYIRLVRPFIRVIRLVSFTLRGMDRLVRRYSQWLDHNLLFFEPSQSIYHRPEEGGWERANRVYAESLALMRQQSAQLETGALATLLPCYIDELSAQIRETSARLRSEVNVDTVLNHNVREIPVEHVIHQLVNLQGAELETMLGYQFPKRLYMLVGLFDLPLINRVPVLNTILMKRRHSTASEFAAWWLRGFGKLLEVLMSIGYWFADLYGVVTGPKIIDRVGSTLVRSFERPAKRLLIFGALLLTLQLLVGALGVTFLDNIVSALQRFIGVPMIVIGSICFVPLVLGKWMKKIAGQAEGLYRMTAEAQFINLLKDLKEQRSDEDLRKVYDRVVAPEEELNRLFTSTAERDVRRARFISDEMKRINTPLELISSADPNLGGDERVERQGDDADVSYADPAAFYVSPELVSEREGSLQAVTPRDDAYWLDLRLHQLYRDYLDGALLHHTDIKTTEQLLGNLSMRSLFEYKLNLTPSERKEIEQLDLGTQRSLVGPFMWFNLITQSVSQASAQLVIDYNRYVLPLQGRDRFSEETRALFEHWLKHKDGIGLSHAELEERKSSLPLFNTTDITILQILTNHSTYQNDIRARFGSEVLRHLEEDQKNLIRGIFSCYPLYQLPKPMRTLNPYQLYNEFIQGGQVFLLPFRILGLIFKGIKAGLKWTKVKIDEIRFPEKIRAEVIPQKDFIVAQRKIDRMRKPIFMKLLKLRAQVDFTYLGINVDEVSPLGEMDEEPPVYQDLDTIKAIEVERLPIYEQVEATQSSLREFYEYLARVGLSGGELNAWVNEHYPHLVGREAELLRAFMTAYLCNFKELQSYLQTKWKLNDFFEDSLNGLPNRPFRLHNKMLTSASRAAARLVTRGEDRERKGFRLFWDDLGLPNPEESESTNRDYEICWQRYLAEGRDLNPLLIQFSQSGLPRERQVFHEVAQTLSMWTDELITLRMIQTLALMDIENYRRYIKTVGSYDEEELEPLVTA